MECNKYLRGIYHQGVLCDECNIVLNRVCSSSDLPICELFTNAQSSQKMSIKDNKFGLSLCLQFNNELTSAPEVIIILTKEIERKAANTIEIDLYNCIYQTSADDNLDGITVICDELNNDLMKELGCYSIQSINSVLKKFLGDLPDPVIPVQFYEHFIEAASKFCFTIFFCFLNYFNKKNRLVCVDLNDFSGKIDEY